MNYLNKIIDLTIDQNITVLSLPTLYKGNVVFKCKGCGEPTTKQVLTVLRNGNFMCTACTNRSKSLADLKASKRWQRLVLGIPESAIIVVDLAGDHVTYTCPKCGGVHTKHITNLVYKGTGVCTQERSPRN
jgi:uncharacterized Zn finger protein